MAESVYDMLGRRRVCAECMMEPHANRNGRYSSLFVLFPPRTGSLSLTLPLNIRVLCA